MRQFVARNVLFLILVNIVIKPFWIFGIDTQVQNAVGNEAYGAYFAFFNLCLIFQIVMDLGLQSYATNTIAKAHKTFATLFPNILVGKCILTLLYLIIIGVLGWTLNYNQLELSMLYLVSCIQIANSFLLFLRSNIGAFQKFAVDSFFSVFDRLLLIIACGTLLYIPVFKPYLTIQTFVLLQIACVSLACIFAAYYCSRLMKIYWSKVHLLKIWVIIKKALPYAFLIFAMALFIRVDTLILQFLLGNHSVGLYGAAFRLLDVINNSSGVLIAGILLPFFAKNLITKQHIEDVVALFTYVLLPFSFLIAIVVWFWQVPIMDFLYVDNDAQFSFLTLGCLLFAYPFYCLNYIYSTLLTANANIFFLIKIAVVGIIINLAINIAFVPQYNIVAAALASVITIATVSIACTIKVQQLFQFNVWTWAFVVKLLIFIAVMTGICVLIQQLHWHFMIQIGSAVIIGIIAMLVLRFINWKSIIKIVK